MAKKKPNGKQKSMEETLGDSANKLKVDCLYILNYG